MKFLLIITIICFFYACKQNDEILETMTTIEEQIQTNPQQVLSELESINGKGLSNKAQRNKYHLLKTYCQYKLFQEGDNDSIINEVESYYTTKGTTHETMLSLFLHGVILYNAKREGEAMIKYKKAIIEAEKNHDHYILGQIYSNLVYLCGSEKDGDAVEYAQKALNEYILLGNPKYILDAEINIGLAYSLINQPQKCLTQLQKTLSKAELAKDTFSISKCIPIIAEIELECQDYESSLSHYRQLKYVYNKKFSHRDYEYYAILQAHYHNKDSAIESLNIAKTMLKQPSSYRSHKYTTAKTYKELGEYEEAYKWLKDYYTDEEEFYIQRLRNSVMKEQRDFVKNQLELAESKKIQYIYTIGTLTIIIFLISTCFFVVNKHQRTKILLQKEVNRHYEEVLRLQKENAKNILRGMKQSAIAIKINDAIIKGNNLTNEDWKCLNELFSEMMPSFEMTLRSNMNLSESEWQICMLQKLDYTNNDIASLCHRAKNTISSTNAKLYKMYHKVDGGSRKWTEFIKSI